MPSLLIRRAEVDGALVDVRCADGLVSSVTPAAAGRGARDAGPSAGADVEIDAAGGALLPGLHDHHVHLLAMAAASASVALGPPSVASTASFDAVLAAVAAKDAGWLRGVGYHESIAGPLDRWRLDALAPHRPVRVQHRTGQMWVLNSVALRETGLETLVADGVERDATGVATGRLFRLDEELRARVGAPPPDVDAVARTLAAFGITGVTDMTPSTDVAQLTLLAGAAQRDGFPLHIAVTGAPALAEVDVGLPRGPVKIVLDDARLPPLTDLLGWIATARRARRAVAVHCVTRVELLLALAAWDEVGVEHGDRIEHGAVVPFDVIRDLRERGLTVVTQPSFVADRGDQYLADVDPDDVPHLWRCGSLIAAGVSVAGSSDAPFGDPDPWQAIAAARDRQTPTGIVLGRDERITARRALDLYLTPLDDPAGSPRGVAPGVPADLLLLDAPLSGALEDPSSDRVVTTVARGSVTTT